MVWAAGNAERHLLGTKRHAVVFDRGVRNHLDQPHAEERGRDPEDEVVRRYLRFEIFLNGVAPGRVLAARHDEQAVNHAIGRSVRVGLESRLSYRSVDGDERRHRVQRSKGRRNGQLRVLERARPAAGRLRVAPDASIEVEARPEASFGVFGGLELNLALLEERMLGLGQSGQMVARSRWSSAHARIARDERVPRVRRVRLKDLKRGHHQQRDDRSYCRGLDGRHGSTLHRNQIERFAMATPIQ